MDDLRPVEDELEPEDTGPGDNSGLTRDRLLRRATAGAIGLTTLPFIGGLAQEASAALTAGEIAARLPRWQPGKHKGTKPPLPRVIAWANVSDAEFFQLITKSIQTGARDHKLKVITANANSDPAKNADQMNSFLQRGCASLCVQPLDVASQVPILRNAIQRGVAVLSILTPPCTQEATNDQYFVGQRQGLAAARYIKSRLGGRAKVVYFNIDSIEFLRPRHKGVLDGVRTAGAGVEIVADQEAGKITQEAGFATMNTIIQAHPDVNVVLGSDTLVLGALSAVRAAGKATDAMYFSGIDGETQALDEVKKGGPYKASFAYTFGLLGYAWAAFTAEWLAGRNIPKVMFFEPIELNSAKSIAEFQRDIKNVRNVWKSGKYISFYGNISYDSRRDYVKKNIQRP